MRFTAGAYLERQGFAMDEKQLQNRLRKIIAVCVSIGVCILLVAVATLHVLNTSLQDITREQMHREVEEYRKRIWDQVDHDFQALATLGCFLAGSDLLESDDFITNLSVANQSNEFVSMAFFYPDGKGVMTFHDGSVTTNADYRDRDPAVRSAVEMALGGTPSVSQLFQSVEVEHMLYVYCLPVMRGDELLGVLAASDQLEVFGNLLNNSTVLGGSGSMHLLASNGDVLISPELGHGSHANLFNDGVLAAKDVENVRTAVTQNKPLYATMNYQGKSYTIYMESMRFNNWYMMCVRDGKSANTTVYGMVRVIALTGLLLLVLILALLFFIVRLIRRNNKRLLRLAYTDPLTHADNFPRFAQKLNQTRKQDEAFALVALNVRQFKFINEIFGVVTADRILCDISLVIEANLREGEFYCRENADSFYLFLRNCDEDEVRKRVEQLIADLRGKLKVAEHDYQVQLYAGAYLHDPGVPLLGDPEIPVTRARFAMQYCRETPGAVLHFYDADIHKEEELENYIESHMHTALDKGEFKLYLQPKFELNTNHLGGAEALVRWTTEEGRTLFPGDFIPMFERNGFCIKLDLYMVEQVFRLIRSWMDAGLAPIPVSVNQTKLLFYESGYLPRLQQLIEQYHIPAELVTLEILEGLALDHADEINDKLRRLRAMGFRISMDDFGSGYASFNTLGNLEIDELKLDRSFLMEAARDKGARFRLIMANIITLSKGLRISTVAEGVETLEDEGLIRMLGCDFGQGYLYSKPIPAQEFDEKYMKERKR